ncbi:MAG: YjbH domain-containing protein [Cypionkella sp.]|uniref:YjbH domain-containing protein n=2 Tax=Cypionkella sp. TaxID=2811411 RepID=UPI002ABA1BA5|nr:YjbH domain-containing protein [Cypionkella sp.]MDZ4310292.1 YjbH domain-containing protein [Cypionkella sp.]
MKRSKYLVLCGLCGMVALPVQAEMRPSLGFSGVTGLIDMPSGEQQSDGTLSVVKSQFGPIGRTTLTFQITPQLSGSFRYSSVKDWFVDPSDDITTYSDRSFDLRYQLTSEGRYVPAITVGLQDIIGTGVQAGEYIAATKTFGDRVKVTAGLGWGRYGSYGSIGSPFGDRPEVDFGEGGKLRTGQWFRGDMAPFAGVEWKVNDQWSLKAEYSSDAYVEEAENRATFERNSPFNFGVEYTTKANMRLGLYSLYGSKIGFSVQLALDPKKNPRGGPLGPGPLPVTARAAAKSWGPNWVNDRGTQTAMRDQTQAILARDGITIESMAINANRVHLRIRNTRLDNAPQAIGRTARALAATMPASVSSFEIVAMAQGVPLSNVVIRRADLEALEFAPGQDITMDQRVQVLPAASALPAGAIRTEGLYPRFKWGLAPYVATSLFDPGKPLQANVGIRLTARYDIAPGWVVSTSIAKPVYKGIERSTFPSDSKLPHVRSDANLYTLEGDPAVERLTLAWYAKPAPELFSRVTVGYLERMYGGISGELLWQQPDKPYALGAEINYVQQRDYDQLFGFRDYSIVTGHVSGYYSFGDGYHAQLDVGRYLAGDYGATLALDREFANGIKVGAFATLTDVPFDTFGEGSFDKGIRISLPMAFFTGRPTQKVGSVTLRPLLRDGGAKLDVEGRLYGTVRKYQESDLDAAWGRFWR